ncbi:MAG: hypothetical protein ACFFD4_20925 [Candidatus Odinarchaeota archaeon]
MNSEEICEKCGEVLTPQTRVIIDVVDKTKYSDMKEAVICFNCFKNKTLFQRKLLILAGLITIVLGIFTVVVADQLVYYMSLPELGGFYTNTEFYWIGGAGLALIGIVLTIIAYRMYKSVQSWKSKADLF